MCFDADSHPPIAPIAGAAVDHQHLELTASDGNRFAAFGAEAAGSHGVGMLICPDVRGLYAFYEELALRFAEAGVDAIAWDYFGRTAGIGERGDGFEYMPHVQQTTWDGVRADAVAAAAWLRQERGARAVFTVGFCFGGRISYDLGTVAELDPAGVIGFYGMPVGPRGTLPAPAEVAGRLRCPVLGLFGGADQAIPPEAVATFEAALAGAGVQHRLVTYPDAPHSFFDRKAADFADASAAAWGEVLAFVGQHESAER